MEAFLGLIFVILSNYFRILAPLVTGYVVNTVEKELTTQGQTKHFTYLQKRNCIFPNQIADTANYDILVKNSSVLNSSSKPCKKVAISG
jgi:hypothetical protein